MPVKRKHQGSEISNPVKKRPSSTRPSIQRPAAAGKAASIHAQDPGDPSPIEPIEMPPAANVLQEFIAAAVRKLPNAQKARAKAVMRNGFAMSSACTGSGMAEVVHILMNREFKTNGAVHFSCEKAAHKRLFVHEVVAPFLNFSSHSFGDIASLPNRVAHCFRHEHPCPVSGPCKTNLFVCGFSCKDFSKLSSKWKERQARLRILADSLGTSGHTFGATVNYCKEMQPMFLLLENVDEFDTLNSVSDQSHESNLDFVYSVFAAIGYSIGHAVLSATDYALPQKRKRIFFLGVRKLSFGLNDAEANALIDRIFAVVYKLQTGARPLSQFLLPQDSPLLETYLEDRVLSPEVMPDDETQWPKKHAEFFESKGLALRDVQPSDDLKSNKWFGALNARMKEVLVYMTQKIDHGLVGPGEEEITTLDLSQSLGRTPRGCSSIVQTITPQACNWIIAANEQPINRILMGIESLCLQAFPVAWLQKHFNNIEVVHNGFLQDLAGNAFPGTIIAAFYIAIIAASPLPPPEEPVRGDDLTDILRLITD